MKVNSEGQELYPPIYHFKTCFYQALMWLSGLNWWSVKQKVVSSRLVIVGTFGGLYMCIQILGHEQNMCEIFRAIIIIYLSWIHPQDFPSILHLSLGLSMQTGSFQNASQENSSFWISLLDYNWRKTCHLDSLQRFWHNLLMKAKLHGPWASGLHINHYSIRCHWNVIIIKVRNNI